MKKSICITEMGLLMLLALVFSLSTGLERQQQRISDSLVRLHVVAASDQKEDQDIKLQVRDRVLVQSQEILAGAKDRTEALARLSGQLEQLTETANWALIQCGSRDRAQVTLQRELFGTRRYADFTLPGGYYEALRVTIGPGEGKNWWCVVYPQLCMAAVEEQAVPAMGSLTQEDADLLEAGATRFRFRCLELLENLLGYFRSMGGGIPTSG